MRAKRKLQALGINSFKNSTGMQMKSPCISLRGVIRENKDSEIPCSCQRLSTSKKQAAGQLNITISISSGITQSF
jgi:hypothetical protein